MSNRTLPIPSTVKTQPGLEVFPIPPGIPPGPEIIQLSLSECFAAWAFVTSGAGVGLEGAWVEGIASTVRENKWFGFTVLQSTNSLNAFFAEIDIGVGAAGFEIPVIDDLAYGWQAPALPGGACLATPYTGPLVTPIPAGSRIAVRVKDNNALALSSNVFCCFWA